MDCGCNGKAYGEVVTMPDVYSVPLLSKGLVHPQVADFRKRLAQAYPEANITELNSQLFDWDLEFALNGYQFVNGLEQTGVTDAPTWAKLLGVPESQLELFTPESVQSKPSGGGALWLVAAAAAAWWALS
jgi:murein L,D-transpeptidase YcbB/YkuD